MRARDYSSALRRVRHALSGGAGEPVVGLTFVAADAERVVARGGPCTGSVAAAACGPLQADFAFVESWHAGAPDICQALVDCGTVPFWVVRGPLDARATERGWAATLADTQRDPAALTCAMDVAVEVAIGSLAGAVACGAGCVVVADDVAGGGGPLVAPSFVLEEILPRIGRIAHAASAAGLPTVWHSDGDTRGFLETVAVQGVVGVHPGGLGTREFDALYAVARGAGLVVLGGLPGETLRAGVEQAVAVAATSASTARNGGLLVCDDGGVSTPEEAEALLAAAQAVRG